MMVMRRLHARLVVVMLLFSAASPFPTARYGTRLHSQASVVGMGQGLRLFPAAFPLCANNKWGKAKAVAVLQAARRGSEEIEGEAPSLNKLELSHSLKLVRSGNIMEMQTAQLKFKFSDEGGGGDMTLDVVLMTHLADGEYYQQLSADLGRENDRVLFEMVASNSSCKIDDTGARSLKVHPSPTQAQKSLASWYGLHHQLDWYTHSFPDESRYVFGWTEEDLLSKNILTWDTDACSMNFSSDPRWMIADLDVDTVKQSLQDNYELCEVSSDKTQCHKAGNLPSHFTQADFASGIDTPLFADIARRTGRPAVQEWYDRGGKHASWEVETSPLSLMLGGMKIVCLALPCPEVSWLLIDWAEANRGELNWGIMGAVVRRASNLDFESARKLVYAQHLVAGQLQDTVGAYRVLIQERNEEALREIRRAKGDGCKRVALLYGAMHAQDLATRCIQAGLADRGELVSVTWRPAWKITDDDSIRQNIAAVGGFMLLSCTGMYHWAEMVVWLQYSSDSIAFEYKDVIDTMIYTAEYSFLHLFMYQVLKNLFV